MVQLKIQVRFTLAWCSGLAENSSETPTFFGSRSWDAKTSVMFSIFLLTSQEKNLQYDYDYFGLFKKSTSYHIFLFSRLPSIYWTVATRVKTFSRF